MTSDNAPGTEVAKREDNNATKKAGKKSSRTRYPWETIRQAFVEGLTRGNDTDERVWLNLKELADHFDVPYQRVRERSASERWTALRHAEQVKLAQERQKRRQEKMIGESLDFDERSLNTAKVGMAMVQARLSEIADQLRRTRQTREEAIAKQERGEKVPRELLWSAVNYKEMDSLARAASTFQDIGMKALGTNVERHEITGADGGPIEVDAVSVAEELLRDDPERLAHLLHAAQRAELIGNEDIVDAEVLDDEEQQQDQEETGD